MYGEMMLNSQRYQIVWAYLKRIHFHWKQIQTEWCVDSKYIELFRLRNLKIKIKTKIKKNIVLLFNQWVLIAILWQLMMKLKYLQPPCYFATLLLWRRSKRYSFKNGISTAIWHHIAILLVRSKSSQAENDLHSKI